MKKELRFGFALMAVILVAIVVFMPWTHLTNGHLGLLMLALVVVTIMLGFPTAFTLMGMGVLFTWIAYRSVNPDLAIQQTLDLMVQRTYGVMSNDVLIAIPLFVFMGYLVERANLIKTLFHSIHLAMARIPGSLAVATLITCAIFATATGIIGAVVTLMGLLALPAMLRANYDVRLSAGAITAGGCLGILIPPSVMLIVYGATAGVSVVQLYAGAFFPGIMLAGLYVGYVIIVAWLKPHLAPPLSAADRVVALPPHSAALAAAGGKYAMPSLLGAVLGKRDPKLPRDKLMRELIVALVPAILFVLIMGLTWNALTKPDVKQDISGLEEMGMVAPVTEEPATTYEETAPGVQEPPAEALQEPTAPGVEEPPGVQEPPSEATSAPSVATDPAANPARPAHKEWKRLATPKTFWAVLAGGVTFLAVLYGLLSFARLEVFKMLLSSFFPLAVMILSVLGTIVFGLATPTEAAAVGSFGGFVLAALYIFLGKDKDVRRRMVPMWIVLWSVFGVSVVWFILFQSEVLASGPPVWVGWTSMTAVGIWCVLALMQVRLIPTVRESVYLTAKTSAMVCWLFVGSSIFSAAFALLGGQEIVETWVLSLNMTPTQFLLLSQFIIFVLGWPLEWTEIIVIFMPIFIPLLAHFHIDPLFFGLLVALNLQTAFLSPPVAMAAFYLKGVAPKHVTLNQIFAGMMPFMAIQVLAMALLYIWPQIGLWLPHLLYK